MVFVSIHAPLLVTSDSITAQQQPVAKMHRVEAIIGFELGFPHVKLRVKTLCNRYLVGLPDDERAKVSCSGCSLSRLPKQYPEVALVMVPSWLSIFSAARDDLVLRDWKTGSTGEGGI